MKTSIRVAAGIIIADNKVLISQRPAGKHLAGYWEFPGGKVEPEEADRDALARELFEELGIEVEVGDLAHEKHFTYPEKSVHLLFFECRPRPGSEAYAKDVDAILWADAASLEGLTFPPANVEVLETVKAKLGNP
jgi:8-oxo-dGTP diphosphatase